MRVSATAFTPHSEMAVRADIEKLTLKESGATTPRVLKSGYRVLKSHAIAAT